MPEPFSFASRRQHRAITDRRGIALLRANYPRREPTLIGPSEFPYGPSYWIVKAGYMPIIFGPSMNDTERFLTRKPNETPTKPDISIGLWRGHRPSSETSNLCEQRSLPAQFLHDLGEAWRFISTPFRLSHPID